MRYEIKELDVGGILDQTITLVKNHFGLLFCITLILFVPYNLLQSFLLQSMMPDPPGAGATPEENLEFFKAILPLLPMIYGLIFLNIMVVIPLTNAAVIHAVACEYLEKPCSMGQAIGRAFRVLLPLIWTSFLAGIVMMIGFMFCIIPGIIFAFWFAFTSHVVVIEGISGPAALGRSKRLVPGSFVVWFVLGLLILIIQGAISATAGAIPQMHLAVLAQTLVGAVTVIFGSAAFVVFYFSCRCKTENFDLTLLAEAVGEEPPESPGFGPEPDPNNPWASKD